MKKFLFLFLILPLVVYGCKVNSDDDQDSPYAELFEITDIYVKNLYYSSSSYNFSFPEDYTSDRQFLVTAIGRMIVVKITHYASNDEYDNLTSALKSRYSGNKTVQRVFRNNGGTVTIDCRT